MLSARMAQNLCLPSGTPPVAELLAAIIPSRWISKQLLESYAGGGLVDAGGGGPHVARWADYRCGDPSVLAVRWNIRGSLIKTLPFHKGNEFAGKYVSPQHEVRAGIGKTCFSANRR